MAKNFKIGDQVQWHFANALVTGTIEKKITTPITFKGYTVHASEQDPQYLIKSNKTNRMAIHKGSALTKIK